MTLQPGTRLGQFEIVAPIGAGGMGEVHRARDLKLGRDVALKILPAGVAHDRDRATRFIREAQIRAALNHPHIGTIYGLTGVLVARSRARRQVDWRFLQGRAGLGSNSHGSQARGSRTAPGHCTVTRV